MNPFRLADKRLTVFSLNVGEREQFRKYSDKEVTHFGFDYDFGSVSDTFIGLIKTDDIIMQRSCTTK